MLGADLNYLFCVTTVCLQTFVVRLFYSRGQKRSCDIILINTVL